MRRALVLGGILGVLAWAPGARAQQPPASSTPTQQVIMVNEVEVRAGASLKYYATAKLRRGDPVVVVGPAASDPTWLAIKPPAGSYSWVELSNVERQGSRFATIEKDGASVLVGSSVVERKPDMEGAKLKRGTILVILPGGQVLKDGNTSYLPVEPALQEVRYIPAEAVRGSTATAVAADSPPRQAALPAATGAKALIQQADELYSKRDYANAGRLYEQAGQLSTADYSDKAYCYKQLAQLAQAGQHWPGAQGAAAQTTALSPGTGRPPAAPLASLSPGWQWSQWGSLRKTTIQKDGRAVYVLEDGRHQPLLYAIAYPGMTLDTHVGKMMTMYGNVEYWGDQALRQNVMTVSQVALLPGSR
jgi:hypothetical protein